MPSRDIVVIGGSAGSIESLQTIIRALPRDFPASIFIVVHLSADFPSVLARQFSTWGRLPATQAVDGEPIRKGHIYVARPDHHLTIEGRKVCALRGPRENRHRPAVDPLFRTAAREFGPRVIGVVLSGLRDDGSAGLYAIKERGGIAIVQDPKDAFWSEMPRNALQYASPHYVLRTVDIAPTLVSLVRSGLEESRMPKKPSRNKRSANGRSAKPNGSGNPEANITTAYPSASEGTPSVFACPECHGVLWELKNKKLVRFRCRVGHSYGADSLAKELSHASESALWAAMRALEEKAAMQRRIADSMTGDNASWRRLNDQSMADETNAHIIRDMIFQRDAELEPEEKNQETQKPAKVA